LLYAQEGRDWMLGAIQGIKATAPQVQSAVNSSIPRIRPSASSAAGAPAGGTTYSPTYRVTITAPGGNAKNISAEFEKMLEKHDTDLIRRLNAGSISSAG
jgi:hypothetical protein